MDVPVDPRENRNRVRVGKEKAAGKAIREEKRTEGKVFPTRMKT